MFNRILPIAFILFFNIPTAYAANMQARNNYRLYPDGLDYLFKDTEVIPQENTSQDNRLAINQGKIVISPELQQELKLEIIKAQKSLADLSNFLDKQLEGKIGLVYIHQGYENWSIQFTYGGYLLDIDPKIIVTTTEVFTLKKIFAETQTLRVANRQYRTTQYMNQLGAILHES